MEAQVVTLRVSDHRVYATRGILAHKVKIPPCATVMKDYSVTHRGTVARSVRLEIIHVCAQVVMDGGSL